MQFTTPKITSVPLAHSHNSTVDRPPFAARIPDHAERVFTGVRFDVYQWEQKLFDGTTTTFEKLRRADTVNVFAVLDDGRILLTKQKQPGTTEFISLPGGQTDPGETPLATAKRELREETGYEASDWTFWYAIQASTQIDCAGYTFIAHNCVHKGPQRIDGGEEIDVFTVTFDEFLDYVARSDFRDVELALKILRLTATDQISQLKNLIVRSN